MCVYLCDTFYSVHTTSNSFPQGQSSTPTTSGGNLIIGGNPIEKGLFLLLLNVHHVGCGSESRGGPQFRRFALWQRNCDQMVEQGYFVKIECQLTLANVKVKSPSELQHDEITDINRVGNDLVVVVAAAVIGSSSDIEALYGLDGKVIDFGTTQ